MPVKFNFTNNDVVRCAGIDPSTKTGLVVLDVEIQNLKYVGHVVVYSKEITLPDSGFLNDTDRAVKTANHVVDVITDHSPDYVSVEGHAFASTFMSFVELEINFAIRNLMTRGGLGYCSIPPGSLKKFVTTNGQAKKELILKNVFKRWGFDTDSNNIADAFGLALMLPYIYKMITPTKEQREVLDKMNQKKKKKKKKKKRKKK